MLMQISFNAQNDKESIKYLINFKKMKCFFLLMTLYKATHWNIYQFRSSHRRCSVKKGAFGNFAKFTRKHLCQGLFFNKVTGLRPTTLFKKRQWHRYFPVNFAKFLRTSFLQNTSRRLLPPIFLTKWTSLCLCQKGNTLPLRKKCPYLEFFRSGFFEDLRFQSECWKIQMSRVILRIMTLFTHCEGH